MVSASGRKVLPILFHGSNLSRFTRGEVRGREEGRKTLSAQQRVIYGRCETPYLVLDHGSRAHEPLSVGDKYNLTSIIPVHKMRSGGGGGDSGTPSTISTDPSSYRIATASFLNRSIDRGKKEGEGNWNWLTTSNVELAKKERRVHGWRDPRSRGGQRRRRMTIQDRVSAGERTGADSGSFGSLNE